MPAKIEIKADGALAKILVDGAEIQDRVSEYEFIHKAGELPKLKVTFSGVGVSVLSQHTWVEIPESIRSFFRKYGVIETETAQSAVTEKDGNQD